VIEEAGRWRRLRTWASSTLTAALSDYRYPRAVAQLLATCAVIIAMLLSFFGVGQVLDRIDSRAVYGECVDDREVAFEVALVDLLLASRGDPPLTPAELVEMRDRLVVATESMRDVGQPIAEGGCPGRERRR
jgi:hypothetical protein